MGKFMTLTDMAHTKFYEYADDQFHHYESLGVFSVDYYADYDNGKWYCSAMLFNADGNMIYHTTTNDMSYMEDAYIDCRRNVLEYIRQHKSGTEYVVNE